MRSTASHPALRSSRLKAMCVHVWTEYGEGRPHAGRQLALGDSPPLSPADSTDSPEKL